jgi:hypothetical protein
MTATTRSPEPRSGNAQFNHDPSDNAFECQPSRDHAWRLRVVVCPGFVRHGRAPK